MAVTLILGIDPSSKTLAIASYEFGESVKPLSVRKYSAETKRYEPWVTNWAQNCIEHFMFNHLQQAEEDVAVFLEAPIVGRGGARPTIVQAYVSGAVQAALVRRGATVYLVNVGE